MDSKLINVYAYLREHHPELDILHGEPTTYIKTLSGNESKKIVFVHKFVKKETKKEESSPVTPVEVEVVNSVEETRINDTTEELVGSPLKDTCNVEELCVSPVNLHSFNAWSDLEESYTGLLHEDALDLLNEIHENNDINHDIGSIWVLLQGDDVDKTLLLELEAGKVWFNRGVVSLKGLRSLQEINVNRLIDENRKMIRSNAGIDIQVDTSYTFYNNTTLCFRHLSENELKNSGFLHNNDCTLRQIFNFKDATKDTSDFLNQIYMLNELFEIIVAFKEDYGDEEGKEPDYRRSGGVDMEIVSNRIIKILSAFPEPQASVEIDRKSLLETALDKAKDRQLEDSTDQLFEILKYCGSLKDLKSALQLIFQTSVKCNVVNMPSANTKLGELIRDVSARRIALPVLTGSQPLELLLEIGLEKAVRDYNFIFEEGRICSASDLKINKKESSKLPDTMNVRKSLYNAATKSTDSMDEKQRKTLLHVKSDNPSLVNETVVGFQNSRFNEAEVQEKLSHLLQIHLILEHLLLIQVNLGTGIIHSAITKQMLKEEPVKLKKVLKDGMSKLEVDVVDHKLKYLIENKSPSAKRISITSQNKFRKLQNVNYFCVDPIFPINVYEKLVKQETSKSVEKEGTKDTYWHYSYTKIGTKRM